MKNLVLVRIDERLIHGQVMTQWCRIRHFNTIMIVDDATANDAFLSRCVKRQMRLQLICWVIVIRRKFSCW